MTNYEYLKSLTLEEMADFLEGDYAYDAIKKWLESEHVEYSCCG